MMARIFGFQITRDAPNAVGKEVFSPRVSDDGAVSITQSDASSCYYVYNVYDTYADKQYIGLHKGEFDFGTQSPSDGYLTSSSTHLPQMIKYCQPGRFIWGIYGTDNLSKKDAYWLESKLLQYYDAARNDGFYNLSNGSLDFVSLDHPIFSERHKKRISMSLTGKKASPEAIEKNRLSHIGKRASQETRKKMSASRVGHPTSAETKAKISAAHTDKKGHPVSERNKLLSSIRMSGPANPFRGKHLSEDHKRKLSIAKSNPSLETRAKISLAQIGRIVSQETRDKMSASRRGHPVAQSTRDKLRKANLGKHLSDAHRRKLSESHKGYKHTEEQIRKIKESMRITFEKRRATKNIKSDSVGN